MSGWLGALGIEALESPAWLAVAAGLALLAWLAHLRTRPAAVGWGAGREARSARTRRFDPVRGAALGLRLAALLALALALAGPVGIHRAPPPPGLGLDMVLVVDASGSMRALDARVGDHWRTRLDLAREVVARFAAQRAADGDRVGLVVFGDTAFTQCPLTGDGALLGAALRRVEAGIAGEATALGDALGLAVKRALGGARAAELAHLRAGLPEPQPGEGRVVVLLTDGRNNAGSLAPELATALAAAAGVRVHTVAIGTSGEQVAMAPAGPGREPRYERHDVDTATLETIAGSTGGRFFPARRSGDLEAVYGEIDALERTPRHAAPRLRHTARPEPVLALAGGLLLCELTLARVARRRLP